MSLSYYSAEHRERKTCKKYFVDITNRIIYTSYTYKMMVYILKQIPDFDKLSLSKVVRK